MVYTPQASAADTSGEEIVTIAKEYLGTPYKWGGDTPSGFDCSGYILYVYNQVGISLPHGSAAQYEEGTPVAKSDLKKGDLVFFANTYQPGISHTGIYIGNNNFISAANDGVVIDSINDPYYWGEKYAGAKRIIEEQVAEPLLTGQYYDVSSDFWAYNAISVLSKQGIINGYDGSLFKPQKEVSRAEVAKMLSEAMGLSPSSASQFSDVSSSHWASGYINAVAERGYFIGYENDTFRPDQQITRAEIASLFTRAFDLPEQSSSRSFTDVSDSHWAYKAINTLTASSIATGYDDQTFKPSKETTRSEFAVFLYRARNN